MSTNPNDAAVLARLVGEAVSNLDKDAGENQRPRYHRWSDDGDQTCAGVLVREDIAPDQFVEGRTVRVLILQQPDRALVSVMAYGYVSRQLDEFDSGNGVQPGDVIAIRRGQLIQRAERSYREWSVQVVSPEGDSTPTSEPPAKADPLLLDPGPAEQVPLDVLAEDMSDDERPF